ncbi:MAG: PKD domain-containing protein [Bacteroidales bacterium]|nr:PKD domain-containing protein [Bacteroidales bacterium]
MKTNKFFKRIIALFIAVPLILLSSCKEEVPVLDPVASFQYEISDADFLEVIFTNYSQNADSYSWDFGDGETSAEENPTHAYTATGNYTVVLTATNADDVSATFQESIEVVDPNEALKLLTGEVSKTWKLYREGVSMSLGPDATNPGGWWEGLTNDGSRPCLYYQEFTFYLDGTYEFNDNGSFWGEYGVFNDTENYEVCFDATAANMINKDGADVSAWLSGTHSFTYVPSAGTVTLNGDGAWIGIPKLGTDGESVVPVSTVTFNVEITEETGYDLMTVTFDWGEAGFWTIKYASYSDPSLEPDVVTNKAAFGEDLPDLTPTEMYNTFASNTDFVLLDTAGVYPGTGPAANSMTFTMGVDDPTDAGAAKVGKYERTGTYQELQFMMENDIQFDNFTTVSLEVYVPSSNDFSGDLTKGIAIIIGEGSQTEQWWTGHIQYDVDVANVVEDQWQTWTFPLDTPTSGAGTYTPYERTDLDFFAISIGGGGHNAPGTFYIRNFKFE